ncbi:beta-galactosidase, partial [Rothia nasisuis]|uniref:beta-galactosidase n=2 Tax=Bacteria TaxID=2 RepID=UPI001F00FBAA
VGPLTRELSADPRNLLQLPDGRSPVVEYFGNRVVPYTLLTDPSIPVNRYRFEALRYVAQRLQALPAAVRNRIVAVTLAGEVHQMFPDFENGMGDHAAQVTTDYSPASVEGFRAFLAKRYGSLQALNAQLGSAFTSFPEIQAPARDAR